MARYIDADELEKAIDDAQEDLQSRSKGSDDAWEINKPYFKGLAWARALLNEEPTADVAEVKHGEWTLTKTEFGWNGSEYPVEYTCSVCGRKEEKEKPYCHCGAKMDGGKKE